MILPREGSCVGETRWGEWKSDQEQGLERFTILFGRGNDAVGNPHRAQISQFEPFELILLLKFNKQFPVEQFEATVSQSTVPSPPLDYCANS